MVKEFIRLQTPSHPVRKWSQECVIIQLSVGDTEADKKMSELIERCGGKRQ